MGLFSRITSKLRQHVASAVEPTRSLAERQLVLQALSEAKLNRKCEKISGLYEVEFCACSQWGEDGIIDWLVERLSDIPPIFIEFGVENYRESNTRLLLQLRNWRGVILDGDIANIADIKSQNIYWRHNIEARHAFIDSENINRLIADTGLSGRIGILSIDIDGNDYWVWDKVDVVDPAIVVCEYNAVFGDKFALTVPYRADFQRTKAHYSNLYFGASLPALISKGKEKGYTFVGTSSSGCNAFFVRNDCASTILDALEGIWAFPSVVREARDRNGRLQFVSGLERKDVIADMRLTDVVVDGEITLGEIDSVYSDEWAAGCGRVINRNDLGDTAIIPR